VAGKESAIAFAGEMPYVFGVVAKPVRECSHIIRIGRELTIAFAERILYAYEVYGLRREKQSAIAFTRRIYIRHGL
jgi:hypothetical protein